MHHRKLLLYENILTGKRSVFLLLSSHFMLQDLGPTSAPFQANIVCCSINQSRMPSYLFSWVNTLQLVCELRSCLVSPAKGGSGQAHQQAGRSSSGESQGSKDWKQPIARASKRNITCCQGCQFYCAFVIPVHSHKTLQISYYRRVCSCIPTWVENAHSFCKPAGTLLTSSQN